MTNDKITQEQFSDVCQQIAAYFPHWTLAHSGESYDMRHTLSHANGLQICLSTSKYDKVPRLTVQTWTWPRYTKTERGELRFETIYPNSLYDPKESAPSITISLAKSPELIAKDIKRRFLPEYERIFARCAEKAQSHQAHEDNSRSQWQEVCEALRLDPKHNVHYVSTGKDSRSVSLSNRNGSLHLEFYATKDQTLAVIAAMRTNN
jgi:hypothetical protein